MEKLKPCPFCGGNAVYSRIPGQGFSVFCQGCGAIAVLATSGQRNDVGAVWNQRVVRPNFSRQDPVKPCPFCASRTSVGKLSSDASILKCGQCGMMVSFAESTGLDATIRQWNRRV